MVTGTFSDELKWSHLESAAMLYVIVPAIIFFMGWFVLPLALLVSGTMLFGVARYLKNAGSKGPAHHRGNSTSIYFLALIAGLSALWAVFGGAGHFFYANSFDWGPRFALARDLTEMHWPVLYQGPDSPMLLRAPLGYYLVPALLANWIGLAFLDFCLYLWTVVGVTLFFAVALRGYSLKMVLLAVTFFVFASGLDVVGYHLKQEMFPLLGDHVEWWAGGYQYSSNTTLLFWVPNHTLGAWIATALLFRYAGSTDVIGCLLPLIVPPLILWSPLSAAGFSATAGIYLAISGRGISILSRAFCLENAVQLLPLIAASLFITRDIGAIPVGMSKDAQHLSGSVGEILPFLLLEVGVYFLLFLPNALGRLQVSAFVVLTILPFFSFGGSNDLVMRGSVPALCVVWLGLIQQTRCWWRERTGKVKLYLMAIIWCLGAGTAANEFARALIMKAWKPDLVMSLPQAFSRIGAHDPFPSHYFVRWRDGDWWNGLFRRPNDYGGKL